MLGMLEWHDMYLVIGKESENFMVHIVEGIDEDNLWAGLLPEKPIVIEGGAGKAILLGNEDGLAICAIAQAHNLTAAGFT